MKNQYLFLFIAVVAITSCQNNNYYASNDFSNVEKVDAHYHIYTDKERSVEQAQNDNFRLLNINTFSDGCERVVEAHHQIRSLKQEHPETTGFTATFCLDGWDEPGWVENTIAWIDRCVADGALAVKVWKNVGMEFRNKDSVLIMIDDPQFDPVFQHLAEKGIPLVAHLGEPRNCWLPLEEMTTKNDSGYFARNPKYHMFLHPEYPSYEEQIVARDRMLEKNPELVFVGCHLASLEWSLEEMALFLDRFPNASMDMAARMGHLFYHTLENRETVRNFFIRYQDRLIYGTDIIDRGQEKKTFQARMHQTWLQDWEYLVTDNKMTSSLVDGEFRGLKLPKEVVDKIYAGNAKKWYGF
ncbi:Amidohydrolase [Mariniphaga anaerophila]|uniref:Amidohydrolase n=1 Tax=Mariniphaga anaerophila TaxID=1484053 RepID=A0A1M4Z0L1_9BACT|nr:amidohydrolase family protein [Mariniphaga anaerophila]SHF11599.1 Amidohydrolase [Mariniphaga anaerophila]